MASREDVGGMIRHLWKVAEKTPGGKFVFSLFVGRFAPYTGSIGATIEELRPGYAKASLRDRRSVRNHLKSVHAMALANFAEICSGIGLMYSLPPQSRGILKGFEISYLKKARGTLTAEANFAAPTSNAKQDFVINVSICDASSVTVATAIAKWRIGPTEEKPS
jgi:acyl-coenzyme A thioesterase PaaI-like protein